MFKLSARIVFAFVTAGSAALLGSPVRVQAQTYPIDCAILLCLSGGWPASAPCSSARAEFIRRITPWPVEPPLQIWRCPMAASYSVPGFDRSESRIFEILGNPLRGPLPRSSASLDLKASSAEFEAVLRAEPLVSGDLLEGFALQLAQDRADIDISGPEFNFVRSIRVYDVRYARQRESGRNGDCNRSAVVVLGTYGTQGDFSWRGSSVSALPEAHVGLERWSDYCPSIYHQSVFVDWRDYDGNYGFEQVNY